MSSGKKIEDLLQQCLEGYDGGMTPEECLSGFPEQRSELEPLLRQALTLRVSFASAPSERFRARAKESLMFAAGRDVIAAMSVEPDADFKMDARQRLIMAGGAVVQESLRDVPPPRLPFWVNARGRILEAAKNPRPQPKPVLAARPALSMSLAGIVAAVAIAGAAFFFSQGSQPSVAAELAAIEQQVLTIERQQANGVFVSPDLLADISKRTNDLAARIKADDTKQVYVTLSLQPLIDRQWTLLQRNSSIKPPVGEPQDALQQIRDAQTQLQQAEEKVQVVAAKQQIAPPAQSQQQPAQAQQPSTSNQQAQPGNNPQQPPAQSQAPAQPTVPAFQPQQSNVPVGPVPAGHIRVRGLSNDRTANLNWVEIRTADFKFAAPANWSIVGIVQDASGIATLGGATSIGFASPDGSAIIFNTRTLNFDAVMNGQAFPSFQRIDPVELAQRAGPAALLMRHMVESLETTFPRTP
jgi:hypothetical protein